MTGHLFQIGRTLFILVCLVLAGCSEAPPVTPEPILTATSAPQPTAIPPTPEPRVTPTRETVQRRDLSPDARIGRGDVYQIVPSPDHSTLAIASSIGVWLHTTSALEEVRLLSSTTTAIRAVAWSPDSQKVVGGHIDGDVEIWDVETGKSLNLFKSERTLLEDVSWSPDGSQVASAGSDRHLRLWDSLTGALVHDFQVPECETISCTFGLTAVAWSPDSKRIVAVSEGSKGFYSWKLETGQYKEESSALDFVSSIAWSNNSRFVALANQSGDLQIWDMLAGSIALTTQAGQNRVSALVWSVDDRSVVTANDQGKVSIVDAVRGQVAVTWDAEYPRVSALAWMDSGTQLIVISRNDLEQDLRGMLWSVETWDTRSQKRIDDHELDVPSQWVDSVHWSPDGTQIGFGSSDRSIRIIRAPAWSQDLAIAMPSFARLPLAWSPDWTRVLAGGSATARVFGLPLGKPILELSNGDSWVGAVAWSPDGSHFALGDGSGMIRVYSNPGDQQDRLLDLETDVSALAWSPDGRYLAASGWYTVVVWDIETGEPVVHLPGTKLVEAMAWSPDGQYLATGESRSTQLWTVATWTAARELEDKQNEWFSALAWSHDSAYLVLGGSDRVARVWNVEQGVEAYRLVGHTDSILSADWSPDDSWIATGSLDGTVRLWKVP